MEGELRRGAGQLAGHDHGGGLQQRDAQRDVAADAPLDRGGEIPSVRAAAP
jgi:hypothetical protein